MSNICKKPMTFGRDLFDVVFAQPTGPNKDVKYIQEVQCFLKPSLGNVSCNRETNTNYDIGRECIFPANI